MFWRRVRYKWRNRKYPHRKWECRQSHYLDIILHSKEELLHQLLMCESQKNLLKLLYYGKELNGYKELLLQVSMKYELLGRMVYVMAGRGTMKPGYDEYAHYLVEGHQETVDEVQWRMENFAGEPIGREVARKIFGKFMFVMEADSMWEVFPLKDRKREEFFYERAFGHLPEDLQEVLGKCDSDYGSIN